MIRDGEARQLTSDGRRKPQAELSPSGSQIAYYEECPQGANCLTSVIILDPGGKRLKSFHVIAAALPPAGTCASILNILWLSETVIAAECHINPSLGEYVETDLVTGKILKDLLGYGFTPSPDRKYVAHVGPIVHFAAPIFQSNYLHIDYTTVYPLLKGARPSEKEPDVVRQRRSTWIGVHEFIPRFSWSPDSERVAFLDCTFDWIEKGVAEDGATPEGNTINRRCSVAVVARTGQFVLFPLSGNLDPYATPVSFSWDSRTQLSAQIKGRIRKFGIR